MNASVIVNDDETFAVITGGKKWDGPHEHSSEGIIIFTEDDGFQDFKTCKLQYSRVEHLSIKVPC